MSKLATTTTTTRSLARLGARAQSASFRHGAATGLCVGWLAASLAAGAGPVLALCLAVTSNAIAIYSLVTFFRASRAGKQLEAAEQDYQRVSAALIEGSERTRCLR